MSKCDYEPKLHFTKEAKEFHINKCVSEKLTNMSDEKKCVEYLSGILHSNKKTSCSIEDLTYRCESLREEFKVKDAEKLCEIEYDGMKKFWTEKYLG